MDKPSWTRSDEHARRGPRLRGVVAALCLTACVPILPDEPELPVSFELNFDFPYRVVLNGDAHEPPGDWWTSYGIYVVPADGGVPTRLIGDSTYTAHDPAWSPDGSQLAYVIGSDIWVSDADGSDARNLTSSRVGWAWSPAWSPDGTQVVFAAAENELGWADLYVIHVDGTGLRRLTFDDRADSPTWRRAVPVPARPGGVVSSAQGGI